MQAAGAPSAVPGLLGLGEIQLNPPATRLHWLALAAGLGMGIVGAELAWHHPLSGPWALVAWGAMVLLAALFWVKTPVLLLAPLPLLGLAPWTGWITFEELDLLVTACGCGGYLAYALQLNARDRAPAWRHALVYSPAVRLLILALTVSTAWSLWRGLTDAGGFNFGWFQGYHEAMNSLRQAKPILLVLSLLPLWTAAAAARPRGFARGVLLGQVLALGAASAAVVWERLSYTGLFDFSTDYRTTGLFWEMHVGGAALDGFLVLTLPFAVLALLRTRSPWRFVVGLLVVLLAAYAVLTTFSRGVYLALPLSLVPMVLLADAQRRRAAASGPDTSHLESTLGAVDAPLSPLAKVGALGMAAAFALAAVLVFGGGGYPGLFALLCVMVVLLVMPASLWRPSFGQRLTALVLGALLALLLGGASWALSVALPGAASVLFGVALIGCALLRWFDAPDQTRPLYGLLVTTCWFWLLATMILVADEWGGRTGRWTALTAGLALGGTWAAMLLEPRLWPLRGADGRHANWRKRALLVTGLVLVMSVVAALGGGDYLRDRVDTWKEEGQIRVHHWTSSLRLLHGGRQWLLGKGAGRFASSALYDGPSYAQVGDYRLRVDEGEAYLALTAGRHPLGWEKQFRLSQRIKTPAPGPLALQLVARTAVASGLVLQVCERNLIYPVHCSTRKLALPAPAAPEDGGGESTNPPPAGWQTYDVQMDAVPVLGGAWWEPRYVTFSMSLDTEGSRVDIARISLKDAKGQPLVTNGDFNREMAHWFFSSDRHHLPWHIKNAALHVLFEQGLVGLALAGFAFGLAVVRLSFGRGRDHPLAPAVVAALLGFAAVGAFDSLLDAPRVGFVFFTILLLGLGLRAMPGEGVARNAAG